MCCSAWEVVSVPAGPRTTLSVVGSMSEEDGVTGVTLDTARLTLLEDPATGITETGGNEALDGILRDLVEDSLEALI